MSVPVSPALVCQFNSFLSFTLGWLLATINTFLICYFTSFYMRHDIPCQVKILITIMETQYKKSASLFSLQFYFKMIYWVSHSLIFLPHTYQPTAMFHPPLHAMVRPSLYLRRVTNLWPTPFAKTETLYSLNRVWHSLLPPPHLRILPQLPLYSHPTP